MRWIVLVLLLPAAHAQSEFEILDEYLATYDIGDIPHCAREAGTFHPPPPAPSFQLVTTNLLLRQHVEWHQEHEAHGAEQRLPGDEDQFGIVFFEYHEQLVLDYNEWRNKSGFETVPSWNPADPIPIEYAYTVPQACVPRNDPIEPRPLPSWATLEGGEARDPLYGVTSLCEFVDLNSFGKALTNGYHGSIHTSIGGDMERSPLRDPIFYGSHAWLVTVQHSYTDNCAAQETQSVATPGWPIAAFIALLVVARRKR